MDFTRRSAALAGLSAFAGAFVPGVARAQRSDWWMRDMNGWMLDIERKGLYGTLEVQKKTIRLISTKDSQGNAFEGANRYLIRFPRGQMPPVSGFWSITVHDDAAGNSIGSQNELIVRPDGTVDIFVQGYPPPVLQRVNWLAWNGGPFRLSLLMNRPSETDPSIFTGSWTPPPVGRIAYAYKYNPNGRG